MDKKNIFDDRKFKEMGIGILEQKLDQDKLPYYTAGYYKGRVIADKSAAWFAFGLVMGVILSLLYLGIMVELKIL